MAGASLHALRKVAANGSWILVDRLLRQGLTVLLGAWIARRLGPAQYGDLAYVLAYLAFFQAAAAIGTDALLLRDMARDPAAAPQILGAAAGLRLGLGLLGWAVAVLGMVLLHGLGNRAVLLTALAGAMLVFQPLDVIDVWFQSQSQSWRGFAARLVFYFVVAGIKVALILGQAPLAAFAAMAGGEAACYALGLALAYRRYPAPGRWAWSVQRARSILHETWPFLVGSLALITYLRIDQIMLEALLGSTQLGLYAAMVPLSSAAQVVPLSLAAALAPFIARAKERGQAEYEEALLKVFRLFGALGLGASATIALLAPVIIPLLYGPAYQAAIPLLMVHGLTNFFIFQGVGQNLWIANESAGKIALSKTVVGAITCVLANWLLLPRLGLMGAALAAIAAQAMATVLSNVVLAPRIALRQLGLRPPAPQQGKGG